jgi:hypothetical protein
MPGVEQADNPACADTGSNSIPIAAITAPAAPAHHRRIIPALPALLVLRPVEITVIFAPPICSFRREYPRLAERSWQKILVKNAFTRNFHF